MLFRSTRAECQQCFRAHDGLKDRLLDTVQNAGRCRYAEMSADRLVRLAVGNPAKEADIRRKLMGYATSAASAGQRQREAFKLFHDFDRDLRAEKERRAVATPSPQSKSASTELDDGSSDEAELS